MTGDQMWSYILFGIIVAVIYWGVESAIKVYKITQDNKFRPYEFRKKPVKIQAVQVLSIDEEDGISLGGRGRGIANGAPGWLTKAINQQRIIVGTDCLFIDTMEGKMRLDVGDWLIQGVKGELYPCKPDIFDLTYD